MGKDFAFMFYPGDYLRDTQCLSENVQVAYDRIMCEHMRNICITQQQLKFFTKKLTEDELDELKMVLTQIDGGYQIHWVAESINKRKAYSESRSENRRGKKHDDINDTSSSYDEHMEDEDINKDISIIKKENKKIPSEEDFLNHCKTVLSIKYSEYEFSLRSKYQTWVDDGWRTGHNKPIKNWKNTINNTIPHLKPIKSGLKESKADLNEAIGNRLITKWKLEDEQATTE